MSLDTMLGNLTGSWTGTNRLWFMPDTPVFESVAGAVLEPVAGGVATLLRYTWSHEGSPHAGAMIIVHKITAAEEDALTWVDSFHTARGMMHFRGGLSDSGALSVLGSYAAPEGPPWGWRIVLGPPVDASLALRMYNITPDGQEMLAVEMICHRHGGG